MEFFRTTMNSIDSVVKALGKFIDFIVDFIDGIINWIKDTIDGVGGGINQSLFDRLVEWARNVISGLMF